MAAPGKQDRGEDVGGWPVPPIGRVGQASTWPPRRCFFASDQTGLITGTTAGTTVTVTLVTGADLVAGTGVTATSGPNALTFTLNAGDVVELLGTRGEFWGDPDSDLSGSLVTASQPVQVISLNAITDVPSPAVAGQGYADHLEETVLPAESLGSHYVVAPPTTPNERP